MSGQENAREKFVGPNVGAGKYRTGKCGTVTCRTGNKRPWLLYWLCC